MSAVGGDSIDGPAAPGRHPADLLRAFLDQRDLRAFTELVEQHRGLVERTCGKILHHPADVDDAVQETFVKLSQHAGSITSTIEGWLRACARNTAINQLNAAQARRQYEGQAPQSHPSADPLALCIRLQERRDLRDCVDALPQADRELILAHFILGEPQTHIARRFGMSQAGVNKRVRKALAALHRLCRDHEH
ncbi:MAG: sigma-70 family RNA polymerase sigma factor [Planctomycetes bacterium]|nr:sigma-70 family RNA polymerase sigma factor [Planctomycetota bacterium]